MKIVVTGGAGFIGSHIVDAYIAQGHRVFVVDDLSTGERRHVNPQADFIQMDILDPGLPGVLARISPDALNHHAAQMDVRRSVADPQFDARVNILGVIHLLESCKGLGLKKVIYASSGGAVYGEQDRFPAGEAHPKRPASPYGISKLTGEHYLSYYQATFGVPAIFLRYANVYGPRQRADGESGVVAIFIQCLLEGKSPTINGNGKQTRDYVYVGDVVAANLAALESPHTGAFNVGTGEETNVEDLLRLLQQKVGSGRTPIYGPAKTGEQRRSSLDAGLAREKLGWLPRTPLSEGLERTAEYCRRLEAE